MYNDSSTVMMSLTMILLCTMIVVSYNDSSTVMMSLICTMIVALL